MFQHCPAVDHAHVVDIPEVILPLMVCLQKYSPLLGAKHNVLALEQIIMSAFVKLDVIICDKMKNLLLTVPEWGVAAIPGALI